MYYKVLTKDLQSINVVNEIGATLLYFPNQWREPEIPHSKLFVFNSLEYARRFANRIYGMPLRELLIYSCEVENPVRVEHIASRAFAQYWKNPANPDFLNWNFAPDGTFQVDRVKLLEPEASMPEWLLRHMVKTNTI